MKYLWLASMWTGYCALHSYLISIGFTDRMSRLLKNYYAFYRLFYVLISIILIVPLIQYSDQIDNKAIITYGFPFDIIQNVCIYGSLLMFFWAFFFDYDSLSFFGIRQILNFGKASDTTQPLNIKRKGLLGIMRHPMYLAFIIFLWCQTRRTADIVSNTILTIYIVIGTILEERKLILEFGDTYVKYQQEVPMLIPFTKAKHTVQVDNSSHP